MNWKKVKLGEICEFLSGFAWSAKKFKESGKMPIIRIQNMCSDKPDDFIYWDEKYDEKFIIKKNDLLLSLSGSIKIDYWKGVDALLNQRIVKITSNSSVSDRWFFWQMQSGLKKIEKMGKWTLVNNVSITDLKNLEIPLPDLATQKHIAEVLDKADALRQQNRQLLAQYDELLQSTFIELFGDPVKKPKGWEVKKLGEVADIVSGVAKNSNIAGDLIEAPYMRVANVQDGQLDLKEIKTINVYKRDFDKYQLKAQDVLMTEGGDPDKLGRAAIWNNEVENCIHQNHIFRVRLDISILVPIYFRSLSGSSYSKRYFLKAAKQTTGIASINMTQLKNFPALIPPLPLQHHFAKIVEQIEAQKAQAQAALAESEALFEGLLAGYFK